MKPDQVLSLTATFEGHAQQTEDGVEYRLARDLQHLLGYAKWDNFLNAISKARTACEVSGQQEAAWGAKVIDRLAADLQEAFPDMTSSAIRMTSLRSVSCSAVGKTSSSLSMP